MHTLMKAPWIEKNYKPSLTFLFEVFLSRKRKKSSGDDWDQGWWWWTSKLSPNPWSAIQCCCCSGVVISTTRIGSCWERWRKLIMLVPASSLWKRMVLAFGPETAGQEASSNVKLTAYLLSFVWRPFKTNLAFLIFMMRVWTWKSGLRNSTIFAVMSCVPTFGCIAISSCTRCCWHSVATSCWWSLQSHSGHSSTSTVVMLLEPPPSDCINLFRSRQGWGRSLPSLCFL